MYVLSTAAFMVQQQSLEVTSEMVGAIKPKIFSLVLCRKGLQILVLRCFFHQLHSQGLELNQKDFSNSWAWVSIICWKEAFFFFPSILQYLSKHCHLFSWVMTMCLTLILLPIYKDSGSTVLCQSQSKHVLIEAAWVLLYVKQVQVGNLFYILCGQVPSHLWLSRDVNIYTSKAKSSVDHWDVFSIWCQKFRYLETSG